MYPDIRHESRDMDCCIIPNEHNDLRKHFTMISKGDSPVCYLGFYRILCSSAFILSESI